MSARDNVVPILIGLAVCGAIVTAGLVIQHNRATVQAPSEESNSQSDSAKRIQPSRTANETERGAQKEVPNWEEYIPTGRLVGPKNAPLTFVEFADFECPACKTLHDQLNELRKQYPGVIAISYHYVPLPYHEMAYPAARAAECAAEQGRFEQYYDKLFENTGALKMSMLSDLATQAGVPDLKKFNACAAKTDPVDRIETDRGIAMGTLLIKGTPTVLVNGMMYYYAPKPADLTQMIEEARSRAGRR